MPDSTDPFTSMAAAMIGMHEVFTSMVTAGFTEQQALYYLAVMMATSMNPPQPPT